MVQLDFQQFKHLNPNMSVEEQYAQFVRLPAQASNFANFCRAFADNTNMTRVYVTERTIGMINPLSQWQRDNRSARRNLAMRDAYNERLANERDRAVLDEYDALRTKIKIAEAIKANLASSLAESKSNERRRLERQVPSAPPKAPNTPEEDMVELQMFWNAANGYDNWFWKINDYNLFAKHENQSQKVAFQQAFLQGR
jgi:hypothetical protein